MATPFLVIIRPPISGAVEIDYGVCLACDDSGVELQQLLKTN